MRRSVRRSFSTRVIDVDQRGIGAVRRTVGKRPFADARGVQRARLRSARYGAGRYGLGDRGRVRAALRDRVRAHDGDRGASPPRGHPQQGAGRRPRRAGRRPPTSMAATWLPSSPRAMTSSRPAAIAFRSRGCAATKASAPSSVGSACRRPAICCSQCDSPTTTRAGGARGATRRRRRGLWRPRRALDRATHGTRASARDPRVRAQDRLSDHGRTAATWPAGPNRSGSAG